MSRNLDYELRRLYESSLVLLDHTPRIIGAIYRRQVSDSNITVAQMDKDSDHPHEPRIGHIKLSRLEKAYLRVMRRGASPHNPYLEFQQQLDDNAIKAFLHFSSADLYDRKLVEPIDLHHFVLAHPFVHRMQNHVSDLFMEKKIWERRERLWTLQNQEEEAE